MPTQLRTLGVRGKNVPTKRTKIVQASDFNIGGIIGFFERKYDQAFEVNNIDKQIEIFGNNINSNWFGPDVCKTFWDNLAGNNATLHIKSHVGYTGSAIDAVVASKTQQDRNGVPADTLKFESAYKGVLDYGISGNRTAYKIINGVRYTTNCNGVIGTSATQAVLDSVIGVKVGDLVVFYATGGTPTNVTKKITEVDESNNIVKWSGSFGADALDNDVVEVPGIKVKTYRKSLNGIETEVEVELGNSWCTLEPEVSQYYIQNIHSNNRWIKITDLSSASLLLNSWPSDTLITYLTSGADGTAPTTSAHWSADLTKMDGLPIRFLANPETSDVSIQKAIETYCKNRNDSPIAIATLAMDKDADELKVIGSSYQRSDDVFQVNVADWLKIDDAFNTAPNAPDRQIPNVGAVMGAWIRTIATLGIHYIPSVSQISLLGINGIVNDALGDLEDEDRTGLAEYGINIIQFVSGFGYRIRNFFTPSIDTSYLFANGILMRNYIKISAEDSLQASENTPNSFNRIKEDREAIRNFLYRLWYRGSTGSVPEGESFGQQQNEDGSLTTPEDHFQVQADAINNPQSEINLGQRTLTTYFTYPTPAGSIEIQVGILLR